MESTFKKFSQVKNIPMGSGVKTPQFYKKVPISFMLEI